MPTTNERIIANLLDQVDALKAAQSACSFYPIGIHGKPWGVTERVQWVAAQPVQREYSVEVLDKLEALKGRFEVLEYGALSHDRARYPLFAVKSTNWDSAKPAVLVTGGVHGYETSGVQGAIRFLDTQAEKYSNTFNIIVAPCVSPWGYERIQRWDANAVDVNRSFNHKNPSECTEESTALMKLLASLGIQQWVSYST
jgi:hypothetical protein